MSLGNIGEALCVGLHGYICGEIYEGNELRSRDCAVGVKVFKGIVESELFEICYGVEEPVVGLHVLKLCLCVLLGNIGLVAESYDNRGCLGYGDILGGLEGAVAVAGHISRSKGCEHLRLEKLLLRICVDIGLNELYCRIEVLYLSLAVCNNSTVNLRTVALVGENVELPLRCERNYVALSAGDRHGVVNGFFASGSVIAYEKLCAGNLPSRTSGKIRLFLVFAVCTLKSVTECKTCVNRGTRLVVRTLTGGFY